MRSFVNTVVGGAIGLIALYVVGRVAYQAGRDIAGAEHRYEEAMQNVTIKEQEQEEARGYDVVEMPLPAKRQSKFGRLFSLRKAFGRRGTSVIGNLVRNPENHVIEACVKGREIHVSVKPRTV